MEVQDSRGGSCRIGKMRPGFTYVSEAIPGLGEEKPRCGLSLICIDPGSAGDLLQRSFFLSVLYIAGKFT